MSGLSATAICGCNARLYLIAFSVSIFSFGVYLFTNDKELLRKRLNAKEKEKAQKAYTYLASLSFLGTFGVSGLDYRFGWSNIPSLAVVVALSIKLSGFMLFVVTLIQNRDNISYKERGKGPL